MTDGSSTDPLFDLVTGTVNAPLSEEFAIAPDDFPEFVRRRIARAVTDHPTDPAHPNRKKCVNYPNFVLTAPAID